MPSVPGKNGGKRPGAGRKPGAAWKPKIRAVARETVVQAHESGRDPLLVLLAIAEDESQSPDTRVKAASAALPYMRPRLSMQVSADVTPKDGEKVDQQQMLDRLSSMLDAMQGKRAAIEHQPSKVTDLEPEPKPSQ